MKTLIAYATSHGATKKYAEALARQIADVEVVDLKQQPQPDLNAYEAVIVGTAIYYGKPLATAKEFCASNLELLRTKRLGLFICSMTADKAEPVLKTSFPDELQASAAAKGLFGGELIMKKLSFGERLIARVVTKGGGDMSAYSEEPVGGFVAAFRGDMQ